ncbi:hypothetical protein AAGW05_03120 [Arthrobacter sp. LAPM80]|uniref:hypothetical protein n=1 Tax=Arthrobacter sp. LAPM80 TaxID=3141788 RepID=UPI00398B870B
MKPLGFCREEMAEILSLLPTGEDGAAGSGTGVADRLASSRNRAMDQRENMVRNLAQTYEFIQLLGG